MLAPGDEGGRIAITKAAAEICDSWLFEKLQKKISRAAAAAPKTLPPRRPTLLRWTLSLRRRPPPQRNCYLILPLTVLKLFEEGAEYVFWMDADSLFLHDGIDLEWAVA